MVTEFERFGLTRYRRLVGTLEVLGALGLLASYWYPPLLALSAGGLALLMVLGVWTRIRIRDSAVETVPALMFCLLNAFVAWHALSGA